MCSTKPLVSILTLTHNHRKFIDEFFDSLLSQTYEDWEIIIGDDCSTDGTQERLKYYRNKYPNKVKLILNKKNLGITKNAQNVLNTCKGKYICTIAGDDLLLPNKIEKQVKVMEKNEKINLCFHDLEVFDENGTKFKFSEINKNTPQKGTMKEMIKYGAFAGASSVMVRKNAIPKKGFDIRVPLASDWLFFVESVGNGEFYYINEVLGKYRRHSENITSNKTIECLNDHIVSCGILLSEYNQFYREIRSRTSDLLFEKAIAYFHMKKNNKAFNCLKSSLDIKFNLKSLFIYLSYILKIDFNILFKLKSLLKKSL